MASLHVLKSVKLVLQGIKYLQRNEQLSKVSIARDFSTLKIANIENINEHFLFIRVSENGNEFHLVEHSLPEQMAFKDPNTLEGFIDQFHSVRFSS